MGVGGGGTNISTSISFIVRIREFTTRAYKFPVFWQHFQIPRVSPDRKKYFLAIFTVFLCSEDPDFT